MKTNSINAHELNTILCNVLCNYVCLQTRYVGSNIRLQSLILTSPIGPRILAVSPQDLGHEIVQTALHCIYEIAF